MTQKDINEWMEKKIKEPIKVVKTNNNKSKSKNNNLKGAIGFEDKLWEAVDKMRNNMYPAEYKHVALGLIFLKYISDAFEEKYAQLKSAVEFTGDEILKKMAKELVREVRQSASIDFTVKASVKAKMRITIKRLLKKYKYHPDQRSEAVRLIMEQAQLFGEEWTVPII